MGEENNSEKQGVSRRDLFQVIGSAPVLAAVAAGPGIAQESDHPAHSEASSAPTGTYHRRVFDDHQWRTVSVLCDLIVPADERSGSATQAGVPEFIDDWIAFRKEQGGRSRPEPQIPGGLIWLDRISMRLHQKKFADASQGQQQAILQELAWSEEETEDGLEAQILGGLAWLDRESASLYGREFADASPDQQKTILDRIAWPQRAAQEDRPWVVFFNRFRNLTVSGFFSSKMGVADLPYLGNTAVSEWKGCDPKVWAILEDRMKNGYKGVAGDVKPWGN